jgi:hypothetical protein
MQKNHKEITYCREAEGKFSVTLKSGFMQKSSKILNDLNYKRGEGCQ